MPDLGNGPISVVSHGFDQKSDSTWAISFIGHFFVMHTFFFTRATADRPFDRVVGHIAGFRIKKCFSQASVAIRISTPGPSSYGYFLDELCEELTSLGIERTLLVFDTMPLRVS